MQTSRPSLEEVLQGLAPKDIAIVRQALTLLIERAQVVLTAHRSVTPR
jgi:hypothetical protein